MPDSADYVERPACSECRRTDVEVGRYPAGRWLCFDCDIKLQDQFREKLFGKKVRPTKRPRRAG